MSMYSEKRKMIADEKEEELLFEEFCEESFDYGEGLDENALEDFLDGND